MNANVGTPRSWESFTLGSATHSERITVTEAHVVNWASLTGDWVPLHMDAEYAAATQFGQRIAHGPLTFALALGLITRTGLLGDCVVAWLGVDELRLPKPVLFGDTIGVSVVVAETRATSKPDRGLTVLAYTVTNQHQAVVMTFKSSFLLHRSGATE